MEYISKFKKSLRECREDAVRQKFLSSTPIYKAVDLVRELGEAAPPPELDEREVLFRVTDSSVDREGDIILSAGVDVSSYEANGLFLYQHDPSQVANILGYPSKLIKGDTEIQSVFRFFDAETNPDAERILRMIQASRRGSTSVGILIHEYTEANDRAGWMPLNILRSELLEVSFVPVPANAHAMLLAAGDQKEETAEDLTRVADEATKASELVGISEAKVKDIIQETLITLLGSKTISVPCATPVERTINNLAQSVAH